MKNQSKFNQEITFRLWAPVYFFRRGMAFVRRQVVRETEERADEVAAQGHERMRERLECRTLHGQLDKAIRQADALMEEVRDLRTALWMTEERLGIAEAAKRWLDDLISKMLEGPDGMELGRMYLRRRWQAMLVEREESAVAEVSPVKCNGTGKVLSEDELREWEAERTREMELIRQRMI